MLLTHWESKNYGQLKQASLMCLLSWISLLQPMREMRLMTRVEQPSLMCLLSWNSLPQPVREMMRQGHLLLEFWASRQIGVKWLGKSKFYDKCLRVGKRIIILNKYLKATGFFFKCKIEFYFTDERHSRK